MNWVILVEMVCIVFVYISYVSYVIWCFVCHWHIVYLEVYCHFPYIVYLVYLVYLWCFVLSFTYSVSWGSAAWIGCSRRSWFWLISPFSSGDSWDLGQEGGRLVALFGIRCCRCWCCCCCYCCCCCCCFYCLCCCFLTVGYGKQLFTKMIISKY